MFWEYLVMGKRVGVLPEEEQTAVVGTLNAQICNFDSFDKRGMHTNRCPLVLVTPFVLLRGQILH